jgi:hypothetical protein
MGEEDDEEAWKDEQHNALAKAVGEYVILFQQLEAKIDTIFLLFTRDCFKFGQIVLSRLSNREKLEAISVYVNENVSPHEDEFSVSWLKSFNALVGEIKSISERRNRIVHSSYLYDFLKIGHPIMISNRKLKRSELKFENEDFNTDDFNEYIYSVSSAYYELNFVHVQLIHWVDKFK